MCSSDHRRVVARARSRRRRASKAQRGVPHRQPQLGQPLDADGERAAARYQRHAVTTPAAPARRRTRVPSRAAPPARRCAPVPSAHRVARGRAAPSADDRLPTAASDAQVTSSAPSGRLQGPLHGLEDLGPAGVRDPVRDVGLLEAVVGEEALDVRPEVCLATTSATLAASTIRKPDAADVPAHDALGVGVEPRPRGDDLRSADAQPPRPAAPPPARRRPRRRRTARTRPGSPSTGRRAARSASTARPRAAPRRRRGGRPGSRAPARCPPRRRRSRARTPGPA